AVVVHQRPTAHRQTAHLRTAPATAMGIRIKLMGGQDPQTKQAIPFFRERVDFLIKSLSESRTKILIPTPALSEVLVHAGPAMAIYMDKINKASAFRIAPFDARAAINVALMTRIAINEGGKRGGLAAPWAKIKYDRQIVAIAQTEGASIIYSDDGDIYSIAGNVGIKVVKLAECPIPPELAQPSLPLEEKPR
ncbi:MAG: hypothetical protein NTU99_10920, partial [Pseudanabaena sp. LacPavin_0818_WC45_MAG_42_6]|nr:hypothetical protein [Pseudanabaena sp. LacPavin_0818_WC45_MAG_42_6]